MTRSKTGFIAGEAHPNNKLSTSAVIDIFLSRDKEAYLAKLYNVSTATIGHIRRSQTWTHLTRWLDKVG